MRRQVFQAIADPTRRAILVLIALHSMTPNAIAEHFDTTRQAISKHLRILHRMRIDNTCRSNRDVEIYYQLEK